MPTTDLITANQFVDYSIKEAGPIVLALGLVLALGGVSAAAVIICGWGRVKSVGVNWSMRRAEILCR